MTVTGRFSCPVKDGGLSILLPETEHMHKKDGADCEFHKEKNPSENQKKNRNKHERKRG